MPETSFARLSEFTGEALIRNAVMEDWKIVNTETFVPSYTVIRIGEGSQVKLTLWSGTVVWLDALTQITITKLNNGTNDQSDKLQLDYGTAQVVGAVTTVEIHTPVGVVSGANVYVSVEYNPTTQVDTVGCLAGSCYYANPFGTRKLNDRQWLESDGSTVPDIQVMGQAQLAEWNPTLVPEVLTLTPRP